MILCTQIAVQAVGLKGDWLNPVPDIIVVLAREATAVVVTIFVHRLACAWIPIVIRAALVTLLRK